MPRELRVALLAAATALAFADSSIVVLGLPEILARFDRVEVVGEPVRLASNFVQGYTDLPVILRA